MRSRKTHRSIRSAFGPGTTLNRAARHDPQRITGAASIEEILGWVQVEKDERRFALLVETTDHAETRGRGWTARRKLIRLAGDFRPAANSVALIFTRPD